MTSSTYDRAISGAVDGAAIGGIWGLVQTAFTAPAVAYDREAEIRRLSRMSDADLAARGLSRAEIRHRVYAG